MGGRSPPKSRPIMLVINYLYGIFPLQSKSSCVIAQLSNRLFVRSLQFPFYIVRIEGVKWFDCACVFWLRSQRSLIVVIVIVISTSSSSSSSKYYIEQTHMRAVRTASIKRALLMSCWYHVNERRPLGALTPTHTHTLKRWACNYVIDRGARFERVYGF